MSQFGWRTGLLLTSIGAYGGILGSHIYRLQSAKPPPSVWTSFPITSTELYELSGAGMEVASLFLSEHAEEINSRVNPLLYTGGTLVTLSVTLLYFSPARTWRRSTAKLGLFVGTSLTLVGGFLRWLDLRDPFFG